jgi:hypothetical protein
VASRSGAGAQALAVVLYLSPAAIVLVASIVAALALRWLVPRVYTVMTGGRGPRRRVADQMAGVTRAEAPERPAEAEEAAATRGAL